MHTQTLFLSYKVIYNKIMIYYPLNNLNKILRFNTCDSIYLKL